MFYKYAIFNKIIRMLIAPGIIYSIINIDASVESEENTIDQM
jgi:hypothetical protein